MAKFQDCEIQCNGKFVMPASRAFGRRQEIRIAIPDPKASFSATGAVLKALGSTIEWKGVFPTEAFQSHRLQALSVS
jgi:hypothetical protein